ncbi:MAG TPA: hypothetical protein VFW62_10255 [bacterium]|nr:hypothetical protein [bacterium]
MKHLILALGLLLSSTEILAASSIETIMKVVEEERSAGRIEKSAYEEVMLPLEGAKTAQAEGDQESYKSFLEAARLVITSSAGQSVQDAAALRLLLEMQ